MPERHRTRTSPRTGRPPRGRAPVERPPGPGQLATSSRDRAPDRSPWRTARRAPRSQPSSARRPCSRARRSHPSPGDRRAAARAARTPDATAPLARPGRRPTGTPGRLRSRGRSQEQGKRGLARIELEVDTDLLSSRLRAVQREAHEPAPGSALDRPRLLGAADGVDRSRHARLGGDGRLVPNAREHSSDRERHAPDGDQDEPRHRADSRPHRLISGSAGTSMRCDSRRRGHVRPPPFRTVGMTSRRAGRRLAADDHRRPLRACALAPRRASS
jgi:hypothetical protein